MRTIRLARPGDLTDVLRLLNDAASWLRSKGLDQWPEGFSAARIGPMIDRREVYLVHDNGQPVATVTASPVGDPDFWTPAELAVPSLYVAKLAIDRDLAGEGLGALLLRWTIDHAARTGATYARLDAWRTNQQLHDFYRKAGWTYIRTVVRPHRKSGALFQHPAVADTEAHRAFIAL